MFLVSYRVIRRNEKDGAVHDFIMRGGQRRVIFMIFGSVQSDYK